MRRVDIWKGCAEANKLRNVAVAGRLMDPSDPRWAEAVAACDRAIAQWEILDDIFVSLGVAPTDDVHPPEEA